MNKLIGITLFIIILITFLANPAPVSIEWEDLVLIALPLFLGVVVLAALKSYKLYRPEFTLLLATLFYLSYLLLSMVFGLIYGVPLLNVLRSLGPYIDFFPLILLGLLPGRLVQPWMIAAILIVVGLLQAGYQIYLFLTHSAGGMDTFAVLRSRITQIEPRTTLPIVLSISIIPVALFYSPHKISRLFAGALILIGVFATAVTLTRSIIISIIIGWLTFIVSLIYFQIQRGSFSGKHFILKFSQYLAFSIVCLVLISLIPKVQLLEQGLLARFYYHGSTGSDYSNGRLYDEWLPALKTWTNSGTLSLLFGMGAGSAFTVASGEERTYIHNLVLYSLVYGGIYGLLACLWLYLTLFKTFMTRALMSGQVIYIAFAALLASLFSYAQLFAVHKGLAFNAMLFLLITLALCSRRKKYMIME